MNFAMKYKHGTHSLTRNTEACLTYSHTRWGDKINAASRQNEEVRGEYADYLTEKYLSNRLDPLPPSRTISAVRKEMLSIIETFAVLTYLCTYSLTHSLINSFSLTVICHLIFLK